MPVSDPRCLALVSAPIHVQSILSKQQRMKKATCTPTRLQGAPSVRVSTVLDNDLDGDSGEKSVVDEAPALLLNQTNHETTSKHSRNV